MTPSTTRPEVWQRGPVAGVDAVLMPVAHALLQVQEDLLALASRVSPEHAWMRPGGAASIAFHVRHAGGSVDRLLTYARGEALSEAQRAALAAEARDDEPRPALPEIVGQAVRTIDRALAQVRNTPRDNLLEPRKVGRAGLPSTTLGLLFHAAEHATRHAGQALTTATILAGEAPAR
ncbi:MAG: DinB family protein [Luteitalea sp.]|nr:DinB family protein [Luteitalea sp.]